MRFSRPALVALAVALALAACGPGERAGERPDLLPLAPPDLNQAEPTVRDQIAEQQAALEALRDDPATGPERLAGAFGDLGLLYVTYSFLDAAEVCFRNARALLPEDYRWPYLLGYLFEVQGRLGEAVETLERSLELAPSHQAGLLRLGKVRLELGDAEAAGKLYARVLELDPGSAAARDGLGKVAAAKGDAAAAVEEFQRALELQPSASSVHHALGLAYRRLGDLERARHHLERGGDAPVLFEDPLFAPVTRLGRSAELYLVRAAQAFSEERYDLAAASYRQALDLDPADFAARKALGFCLEKLGDIDGAIEQLQQALRLGSTGDAEKDRLERAEVYRILGGLKVLYGDEGAAIEAFATALELDPERADARLKLANALARQGRFAEAVEHYDRVLADHPETADVEVRRATALINLERRAEALEGFERAVAADPDDPEVRMRYAEALEHLGRAGDAARQRAAAGRLLDRDEGGKRVELLTAEGDRLQGRGELEAALERYREALEIDPGYTDARYQLAATLGHLGRLEEALAAFDRVIADAPRHGPARRGQATALVLQGRYGEARVRLNEALKEMPADRALAHLLARVLATAPDPRVRDGLLAVELARRIFAAGQDRVAAETLAMAFAEAGDLDQALRLQQDLVARAEGAGDEALAGELKRRLDSYRRREPWRAASPDEMLQAAFASG